jgi:hypothetical protein
VVSAHKAWDTYPHEDSPPERTPRAPSTARFCRASTRLFHGIFVSSVGASVNAVPQILCSCLPTDMVRSEGPVRLPRRWTVAA